MKKMILVLGAVQILGFAIGLARAEENRGAPTPAEVDHVYQIVKNELLQKSVPCGINVGKLVFAEQGNQELKRRLALAMKDGPKIKAKIAELGGKFEVVVDPAISDRCQLSETALNYNFALITILQSLNCTVPGTTYTCGIDLTGPVFDVFRIHLTDKKGADLETANQQYLNITNEEGKLISNYYANPEEYARFATFNLLNRIQRRD